MLTDFSNLYLNGNWWLSGAYLDPPLHTLTYHFAYPPSSLPFLGLFAEFDFGTAAQLWITASLVMFVAALLSVFFIVKPNRRYLFVSITALLFFTSYPLQVELQLGQINLLIASLTVLSLVTQRLNHRFVSATLLAIGTLIKGPPALFLIYFVAFRRDLRYLVDFLTAMLAIVVLTFFFVPIQLYWYWIVNIVPTLFVSAGATINESITGSVSLDGLAYLTPAILLAGFCTYALFAFYVNSRWLKGFEHSSLSADAMFLMNTLIILLLGSRSWPQDYVWVILPAALFLSGLIIEDVKTAYFALIVAGAFLFNLDTYPLFPYYFHPTISMIPTAVIGNLLMFSCLILFYLRNGAILQDRPRQIRDRT